MICKSLSYTCDATGTLKFYLAREATICALALANGTGLKINTDAAGKVGGALITTSDIVLVMHSGASGAQLRTVSSVAAVSSGTVTLTLGANATAALGDKIYIVRAADIHTIVTAAETKTDLGALFCSYPRMPVAVELAGSTGAKHFSALYEVEDI